MRNTLLRLCVIACIAVLFPLSLLSQEVTILSPSQGEVFDGGGQIPISARVGAIPLQDPTRLHVWNNQSGWRKLKIGNNPKQLYSPKVDVSKGGNEWVEILLKDHSGQTNWSKIEFRPQGHSTMPVNLAPYIPANIKPGDWFVCYIPMADFDKDTPFTSMSLIEFPYSVNVGNWEISIGSIRFIGGTSPYEWIGPGSYNNYQDGEGKPGQVYAEWITGMHTGNVIPNLDVILDSQTIYQHSGTSLTVPWEVSQGQHQLMVKSFLGGALTGESEVINFSVQTGMNHPPLINIVLPSGLPVFPDSTYIPIHISAMDPDEEPVNLDLYMDERLIANGIDSIPKTWVYTGEQGSHTYTVVATDPQGLSSSQNVLVQSLEPQTGSELGRIISPVTDTAVFIPIDVEIRAIGPETTAIVIPYLRVSNPYGGYRKLKIASNPNSLYNPRINLLEGGNNVLELIIKDFNGQIDWSRILVCPEEILTHPVNLAMYWQNAELLDDGWRRLRIPLQAFDPSIDFTSIRYLALPYSRNAGNFIIGIREIKFAGGTQPYLWFGGNKIDNKTDGLGGGGQLTCELINDSPPQDPQIFTLLLTVNDSLLAYDHAASLDYTHSISVKGTSRVKLFTLDDKGELFYSDQREISGIEPTTIGEDQIEIVLQFSSAPTQLSTRLAPLKYNKDFAYSFSLDDGLKDAYTNAFKAMNGGVAEDGQNYPPLVMTDGCGNDIEFSGALAIYSINQYGQDLHIQTPGNIKWSEILEMYGKGWDVLNHTYAHHAGEGTDYVFQIEENQRYVQTMTGIKMRNFVIPSGDLNYKPYAFSLGMHTVSAYNASFLGFPNGIDVDENIPAQNMTVYRRLLYDSQFPPAVISSAIDAIAAGCNQNQHIWFNDFTHRVSLIEKASSIRFSTYVHYLNHLYQTYGKAGNDRIWVAGLQQVYEYLILRDMTDRSGYWDGLDYHLIIDRSRLDKELTRYAWTILVDTDQPFTVTCITPGVDLSFNGTPGAGLINLDLRTGGLPIMKSGIGDENQPSDLLQGTLFQETLDCSIYPNPATEYLQVVMFHKVTQNIYWSLFNSMGIEVLDGQITEDEVETIFRIDFGIGLPKGMYFLTLLEGAKRITKKILVN